MTSQRRTPLLIFTIWFLTTLFWWGLAFFPTPQVSPEWLVTARNVCFGTMESGLPGPSGWMVLVLGPLSFLIAILVAWPNEWTRIFRQALASGHGRALLLVALAAVVIEAGWVVRKIQTGLALTNIDFSNQSEGEFPESYPRLDSAAPDFKLIDQFENDVRLSDFKGQAVLLTFAFAHCQTVCPILVRQSLEAVATLSKDAIKILIVTLDPWRDTPKSLPFLAEKWNLPENARVLSGSVDDVVQVLRDFNVPATRDPKTGEVTHPALTYLISPAGKIAYAFNNAPTAWLSQAIERIGNGKDITATGRAF